MSDLLWAPSPELDFDLAKPPAERFAAVPESVLLRGRMLLNEVLAFVPPAATKLAWAVRVRTINRFQSEIDAWAARLGIGWRELVLANVSYDLALAYWGCSTAALATPGGPRLVRNMDWMPEGPLARATCAMRYAHAGNLRFAAAGFPGAVGVVTGVSARGFALALNAVGAPGGPGHDRLAGFVVPASCGGGGSGLRRGARVAHQAAPGRRRPDHPGRPRERAARGCGAGA